MKTFAGLHFLAFLKKSATVSIKFGDIFSEQSFWRTTMNECSGSEIFKFIV